MVGAIGSGVWDVVAKPGLSRAANLLLGILASGSSTLRDLPYSMAALNPYSLPPLLLFLVVATGVPGALFGALTAGPAGRWLLTRIEKRDKARRQRALRVLVSVAFAYALFLAVIGVVSFSVLNRAIAVRRIHEANMEMIAPFVPSEEVLRLRAQFASMVSRADYLAVVSRLKVVAAAHQARLRDEEIPLE